MVQVLNGVEAIRKRPGMYVGDTDDGSGYHHLLWEVVSNVCDQISAGMCTHVEIEIHADHAISIRDDGPGFQDLLWQGTPLLTFCLSQLHDTPSLTGHTPHDHAGIHGVGLMPIAALSRWFSVVTVRNGVERSIRLEQGAISQAETRRLCSAASGTIVSFLPDFEIFGSAQTWDSSLIAKRLHELAALLSGATWQLRDLRTRSFASAHGLRDLLRNGTHYADDSLVLAGTFSLAEQTCRGEWALTTRQFGSAVRQGFANWLACDEGTHVVAFQQALKTSLKQHFSPPLLKTVLAKLSTVVRVELFDPLYHGPTKSRLACPQLRQPLIKAMTESVQMQLLMHPDWPAQTCTRLRLA